MAVYAHSESPAPKGARALAFTASFLTCVLMAGAASITLLGNRNSTSMTLELAPFTAPASLPQVGLDPEPDAKMPPVTQIQYAGHVLIADPALIENTDLGPLPRIADDRRKPMTAYAAPAADGKLKIAIVMSGLGLSAKATQNALTHLPAAITVGLLPYASDAPHWLESARAAGHEVLLEVPMEPSDFPDSDPGPHTLRAGVAAEDNAARLNWALSRFTGYAGVTNLLGDRFLSGSDALSPILTSLARRGLYFYDTGSAAQSAAPTVAGNIGAGFAQGTETIDTVQTALEIDRRLSDLEAAARAHGSAIGSAFIYPVTVERIALWAKDLAARGFVLVPVSALVDQKK
jgi:uncharacterized protein